MRGIASKRVFVVAEAGVNHNGSPALAARLVDAAFRAGADAVKFQTFRATSLASAGAPVAPYQRRGQRRKLTQIGMLRTLELSAASHRSLAARCRRRGILFLSTPYDADSLVFLTEEIGVPLVKIASGDLTNAPLLLAAGRSGSPVWLSTGMGTLAEVRESLGVLAFGYAGGRRAPSRKRFREAYASRAGQRALGSKVTLLHCTSAYPAPAADANLRAMDTLREAFGLPVGYSDHTPGTHVAVAAAVRGAVLVEKHFTLDTSFAGPDHRASLDPLGFSTMVRHIREVEDALGSGRKVPVPSELVNRTAARRSLTAVRRIAKGELFTTRNLGVKRPGTGVTPMRYFDLIGTPARRGYGEDETIR